MHQATGASILLYQSLADANLTEMLLALSTASWISYEIWAYATLEGFNILVDFLSIWNTRCCEIYRILKVTLAQSLVDIFAVMLFIDSILITNLALCHYLILQSSLTLTKTAIYFMLSQFTCIKRLCAPFFLVFAEEFDLVNHIFQCGVNV